MRSTVALWMVPIRLESSKSQTTTRARTQTSMLRCTCALALYDHVRRDFREIHNLQGGSAGNLKIVEQVGPRRGLYEFPFAQLQPCEYRLTKGATYPILAAFRNYVAVSKAGVAIWRGG